MKIKHTKKIEQETEVIFPIYSKIDSCYIFANEEGIIRLISKSFFWTPSDSMFYNSGLIEAIEGNEITSEQFQNELEKVKLFINGK